MNSEANALVTSLWTAILECATNKLASGNPQVMVEGQHTLDALKSRWNIAQWIYKNGQSKNAPITICFENSELVCKPYIWSEICTVPINQLKVQYPNTVILPSTILNHNDSYYFKVLLVTVSHKIPK